MSLQKSWRDRAKFILSISLISLLMSGLAAAVRPSEARATIQIPQNLSQSDRITALNIVGPGTSCKILSDPYPLGGYTGVEAGFSLESIPSSDLSRLGNGLAPSQRNVTVPKFTFGKGLYNNIDFFLQFAPYTSQDELAEYGAIVRWGFFQSNELPMSASVLAHAATTNISNQLYTHTYGLDFVGGVNVEQVALFAGAGYLESLGTFSGSSLVNGSPIGLTDSGNQITEVVTGLHAFFGADIKFSNVFFAAQVDRYTATVFSGKLGVRF